MRYYFNKVVKSKDFDEVINQTVAVLKTEGFGVLTEIDIQKAFKEKIDVEVKHIQELLGKIHNQKEWWRPKNKVYISG